MSGTAQSAQGMPGPVQSSWNIGPSGCSSHTQWLSQQRAIVGFPHGLVIGGNAGIRVFRRSAGRRVITLIVPEHVTTLRLSTNCRHARTRWKGQCSGTTWSLSGDFSGSLIAIDGFCFAAQVRESYGLH